jgi:hypothetical protein
MSRGPSKEEYASSSFPTGVTDVYSSGRMEFLLYPWWRGEGIPLRRMGANQIRFGVDRIDAFQSVVYYVK